MDPRNKEIDLDSLMYGKLAQLNDEDMKKQEADYIYRYRYDGGGATQVWLGSGRYCFEELCLVFRNFWGVLLFLCGLIASCNKFIVQYNFIYVF